MINSSFFNLFTKIESYEDCPTGIDILCWDGCDYFTEYVDYDVDRGVSYPANGQEFIAYFELPSQVESMDSLGDGE